MKTIEEEVFDRCIADPEKLKKFGFIEREDTLVYTCDLSEEEFRIVIEYGNDFHGKIFDLNTNEEYVNYRRDQAGTFSSQIRQRYTDLLTEIRDTCCEKVLFHTAQAERISNWIKETYGDEPEFLWEKFPTYAIFRKKEDRKWYGLIGMVPHNRIDSDQGSEEVEVLNVHAKKETIAEYLKKEGFHEAYHMNKKTWTTVILEEGFSDEEIRKLIEESYRSV